MKTALPLVALCGLLGLCCVDNGSPLEPIGLQLDGRVNGKRLTAFVGQRFTLTLESLVDAGYLWKCQISDSLVVCQEGPAKYRTADPNSVGGLSFATFTFSVNRAGHTIVTLNESQPWMKDVPPRATVTFTVDVPR